MSWRVWENPSPNTSVHTLDLSQPVLESWSKLTCLPFFTLPGSIGCAVCRTRQNCKLQVSTHTAGVMLMTVAQGVELLSDCQTWIWYFCLCLRPRPFLFYPLLSVFARCHRIFFFFILTWSHVSKELIQRITCVVFLQSFRSRSQLLVCRSTQRGWSLLFALNITRVFA